MSASIEASLRLEISQYQAQIAKAKGDAARFKESLKREGDGLGGALFGKMGSAVSGMLPAVSVSAAVAGLHSIISAADDLADAAAKLDTTPQVFQRVQAAAQILGGTDMETVSSALIRLRRQLIEDPGSALAKGLEQLGIVTADFLRLDADEQSLLLADAYAKAQESGIALPLLNEAFGKSFKELIPLLSQGSAGIKEFYGETLTASDTTIARLGAANDRIDSFINSVKNWATEAAGAVLGLGQAILTGGQSMEDEQARADAAAMKAIQAREAQAQEAIKKKAEADAKAATKAAGVDKKAPASKPPSSKDSTTDPFEAILAAQKKLDDAKRQIAEEEMTREEKIADLRERINEEAPVDPFGQTNALDAIQAATRKLELQRELNHLLRDEAKERAQSTAEMQKEAATERANIEKQSKQRQGNRDDEMRSLRVLDLRSRGRDREADKLERNEKILKEVERIRQTTGASEEQAVQMAEARVNLEDKIQRRNSGQRSRIIARPRGEDKDAPSNLDRFHMNQLKDETGGDGLMLPGYTRGQPMHLNPIGTGLSGVTRSLNPGDPKTRDLRDPLDRFRDKTLSQSATRNADRADNNSSNGNAVAELLKKQTDELQRGFFG